MCLSVVQNQKMLGLFDIMIQLIDSFSEQQVTGFKRYCSGFSFQAHIENLKRLIL